MAVTLSQVIFIEKNNFNLKKNQIFLFFFPFRHCLSYPLYVAFLSFRSVAVEDTDCNAHKNNNLEF